MISLVRILLVLAMAASVPAIRAGSDCVVLPGGTNALQFRLFTNASPDASQLFNTMEIDAFGEKLLASPRAGSLLHNVLINGAGPDLSATNSMRVVEQASGPEWRYVAMDLTAAYHTTLQHFQRAILFVEPDLFVLYDQLTAKEPIRFQMALHAPAATIIDTNWGDLRLETPKAGLLVQAPGTKKSPRSWKQGAGIDNPGAGETVPMLLGPTNKLSRVDLITVFGVYRPGDNPGYVCKLLESDTAIGTRIMRYGLPSLVAFRTDPSATNASLTGLAFQGPVGVGVFKPKALPQAR
jgi:hypothetical protein